MGSTQAQGMAEAVSEGQIELRRALGYHLSVNHYPPLPGEYVDVAVEVIEAQVDGNMQADGDIELPGTLRVLPSESWEDDEGRHWCSLLVLADIMHLWPFIESQFEDEED